MSTIHKSIAAMCLMATVWGLCYGVRQADFWKIISLYVVAFGLYWWLVQRHTFKKGEVRFWLMVAVVIRVGVLFAIPNLSDDIYRFVWDGRLLHHGINPFSELPSALLGRGLEGINSGLYAQLNSPDYYTIYPPVAQAVFWVSTLGFPSVWGSSFLIKTFLLLCELGSLFLLSKYFKKTPHTPLWYALNPLIIIEIMGNIHFEGAMVFFLLAAYFFLQKGRDKEGFFNRFLLLSAIWMAFAIASKLLPLLFLPFLIPVLGQKRCLVYFGVVGICLAGLFFPLWNSVFVHHFSESLQLYFQHFEFNAGVYFLLRAVGFWLVGYNLIGVLGPLLASVAGSVILYLAYRMPPKRQYLPLYWMAAITIYLWCSTTVHPWYVALPVVLCLFTPFRYPIVWSGMLFLSYAHYHPTAREAYWWLVTLEYLVVFGYTAWEWRHFSSKNTFVT